MHTSLQIVQQTDHQTSEDHPCFRPTSCGRGSVIHVPLATRCSLRCIYCGHHSHGNITEECLPGVAQDAVRTLAATHDYLRTATRRHPETRVIGVSGPGDPLANIEDLSDFFRFVKAAFPEYTLCLCTNGFGFQNAERLLLSQPQLKYISFTVNALTAATAERIYSASNGGIVDGASLVERQRYGVERCLRHRIKVKVNTVFLPGFNDHEILDLVRTYTRMGATIVNVLKYKPNAVSGLSAAYSPYGDYLRSYDALLAEIDKFPTPRKKDCRQCRSDFVGLL